MNKLAGISIAALVLVVVFSVIPFIGSQVDEIAAIPTDVDATGTITFTGTTAAGETVNISSETYTFTNAVGGAFNVNLGAATGNATYSTSQLVAEITANSTLVTAVDNADNSSTITSVITGTAGNAYATTTNVTGASFAAATLTGGIDASDWDPITNTDISTGYSLWEDVGSMIALAAVIIVVGVVLSAIMYFRKD